MVGRGGVEVSDEEQEVRLEIAKEGQHGESELDVVDFDKKEKGIDVEYLLETGLFLL